MPDTPRPKPGVNAAGGSDAPLDVGQMWQFSKGFLDSRTQVVYTEAGKREVLNGPNVTMYDEESALGLMSNLHPYQGSVDELKRDMYWAGFYGDGSPTVGGDVFNRDDLAALQQAMDGAELVGGMDVVDFVGTLAETGRTRGVPLGTEATLEDDPGYQFSEFAKNNGITLSDDFVAQRVGAIGAGETTLEDELTKVREKFVVGAFPAWADEIRAGQNVADIAAPYRSAMAQTLELPEDQIDLKDPTLRSALQAVGADGKSTYKPLWMFERELKQDERWQYTDNAYEAVTNASAGALREMGF